ncbi:hypothetical protein NQ317_016778 [Molorchus minor]|uniref:Tyr recombinase domain-containing protein n=1 Tax=Molorchus minor TaxID=1323400 RepID=A0ABQ9ISN5_9CUCU|nr:hypothetical protein NQ317_016778 [Molorchus minor]
MIRCKKATALYAFFLCVCTKSKKPYELAYKRFVEWCDRNNVAGKYSENVMLAYFEQNSKIWESSTLWVHFSMIKAMLNVENNQDIKAPDDKFKVVAVMGILGACRREELCQMSLNNIEDLGNTLVVNIPDSKTRVTRTFTVITETYIMPTDVARFLKLPNSELYTGHCFRRTSASLLADSEEYLEDALGNKKRIACHILPNNCPSSNNSEIEHIDSISPLLQVQLQQFLLVK